MSQVVTRGALVIGGLLLLVANHRGGAEGTFLGFYPLDNPERLGFNLSKLAIGALAFFFVYWGVKPHPPPSGLRATRTRASKKGPQS